MIDPLVLALKYERDGKIRGTHSDMAIAIDEELAVRGWCVDGNNELVAIDKVTRSAVKREPVEAERPKYRQKERAVDTARERAVEE